MRASPWIVVLSACVTAPPVAPASGLTLVGGVDTHLHLTMAQAAHPVFHGEPGDGVLTFDPQARWTNMVDGEAMSASGVKLVFAALWPPPRARPGRRALDEALHQLEGLEAFTARRSRFVAVHGAAQARAVMQHGFIAALPQVEGGEGITSVEDVDRLYAAGMRCLTLVHFVSSELGGAASGQLARALFHADLRGRALEPEGLTPLGRAVVERLIELGVVIDLAHASDALAGDVLALTEAHRVPVLVSHTGARALSGMERNLSDALAQRVVAGGGLIGVSLYEAQLELAPEAARAPPWAGFQPGSCDDVVAHWLHFSALVGEGAMVLGTDFNGAITRPAAGGSCPGGVANSRGLPELFAALVAHGASRERLDDQAARVLGLLEKVEAAASREAQRRARHLR